MPEVGDSLGRYTLLRRLAAGGMGEVFIAAKAGPVGFGPYVALKVLREELAIDRQFVDMLVDEANISMFLNHQNVVSVLDLSEDQSRYYIAMEFVQGLTVERLVDARVSAGKKPDIPLGLYIATELCRALKYAHTRVNHAGEPLNIVHRDVTPANILLSTQGEVKLTDFGIARAKGRVHQTQAGVLKGKFGYMAPEMVRYEKIDGRADLFCAGVVVYLMLTGRHPVAGAAVMEAIQMFEERRVPPPKQFNTDISTNLSDIVMKALEPKVENRWASAAAFGDALQDVTLQNPTWRREVQGGSRMLTARIREVHPEVFEEPVERKVLDDLLAKARKKNGGSKVAPAVRPIRHMAEDETTANTGDSGVITVSPDSDYEQEIDTAEKLQAITPDMNFAPTPESGEPDFETEESLKLADIQGMVARESGSGPDTDEDEPAVGRRKGSRNGIGFPDTSTDRHRLHEEMMLEPALPSKPKAGVGPAIDDRTIAGGFDFGEDDTVGAPQGYDMDDGRTLPGGDDMEEFGAPTIATPVVSVDEVPHPSGAPKSEDVDDSKTVAGVSMVGWDGDPTKVPHVEDGEEEFGETNTVVPRTERDNSPIDDGAMISADDDWEGAATEADDVSGDATLLDGIDAAAIQREVKKRKKSASVALVRDESNLEDSGRHLEELVLDSIRTGDTSAKDPAGTGPTASFDPADSDEIPKPVDGPIRIMMNDEGHVLAKEPRPAMEAARPMPQEPRRRGFAVTPLVQPQPLAPPPGEAEIGAETGKWMAGKSDGKSLDWSDDAAARRAVNARGSGGMPPPPYTPPAPQQPYTPPQPQYSPPQYSPPPYQPPSVSHPPSQQYAQASFLRRNWMVIGTFGLAFVLLGVLGYLWTSTNTFWPKLKLDSTPQGAVVTVDGSLVAGKTPLLVRVEPEKRHLIEFRLDGYKRALREITEGIGRGRTYTLTVDLERQPPRLDLPVEATLFINDAQAGRGRTIHLTELPASGEVNLRVEAPGYKPYKLSFPSSAEIPERLDIPLTKAE